MRFDRKKRIGKIWLKAAVLAAEAYALVQVWHWKPGFTFFTQLSTIFMAVMMGWALADEVCAEKQRRYDSGAFAFCASAYEVCRRKKDAAAVKKRVDRLRRVMYIGKYMATVSVAVTFLIYLFILGPYTEGGLLAAYQEDHCASLCFHLIVPLLSAADYLWNDSEYPLLWRCAFYAVAPPLLYMAFIVILGQLGMEWWGMKAPYFFLNYAAPTGWFGFAPGTLSATSPGIGVFYMILIFAALFVLLGLLLIRLQSRFVRRD